MMPGSPSLGLAHTRWHVHVLCFNQARFGHSCIVVSTTGLRLRALRRSQQCNGLLKPLLRLLEWNAQPFQPAILHLPPSSEAKRNTYLFMLLQHFVEVNGVPEQCQCGYTLMALRTAPNTLPKRPAESPTHLPTAQGSRRLLMEAAARSCWRFVSSSSPGNKSALASSSCTRMYASMATSAFMATHEQPPPTCSRSRYTHTYLVMCTLLLCKRRCWLIHDATHARLAVEPPLDCVGDNAMLHNIIRHYLQNSC